MASKKSSSDKKKGTDGKACWKGYRHAGTTTTKDGKKKDKCVKIKKSK